MRKTTVIWGRNCWHAKYISQKTHENPQASFLLRGKLTGDDYHGHHLFETYITKEIQVEWDEDGLV